MLATKTEPIGANGIAHDLNIILMAILSNADLLSLRTANDDPRRSYIEEIRDAVSRGSGLARQLTASGRKRAPQPARVDLMAPRVGGPAEDGTRDLHPERGLGKFMHSTKTS